MKKNCYEQGQKRRLDLTNQVFGEWTVLSLDRERLGGHSYWICKCNCGTIRSVDGNTLRNGKSTSCGCKKFSQGEEKISSLLKAATIPFVSQWTTHTCIFPDSCCVAKFDFYVDNKYIIEFDGRQHFEYTGLGWDSEENFILRQEHDAYKTEWCKNNNIPLIRIPYTHLNKIKLNDLCLNTSQFIVKE